MKSVIKKTLKIVSCLAVILSIGGQSYASSYNVYSNAWGGSSISGSGGYSGNYSTNAWGGGTYTDNRGNYGTYSTNAWGGGTWNFRGEDNPLFSNEVITNAFPADAWIDASATRDTAWMLDLAWQLDGIERRLATKDEKTTADTLYTATAEIAVAQRNVEILEQMVNIWPKAKDYLEEAKALGATRGAGAVNPMPRLVQPMFNQDGQLEEASSGTAYIYSAPLAIHEFGSGLDWAKANTVASALNNGRMSNSPVSFASAAVEIADVNPSKASLILEEAAELAVETENKNSLEFVVSIYQSVGTLADTEKAQTYSEIAKSLGSTRGSFNWMDSVGGHTLKWDGSSSSADMLKLYYQRPMTMESWR